MDFPYLLFGISLLVEAWLIGALAARLGAAGEIRPKPCDTLDGLRGLLAMAVFVSHSATSYLYWADGHWRYPDFSMYVYFGQGGVALFFMITAYLFVGKLLSSERISWRSLYINRFFRIVPLYMLAATLVVLIAFLVKNFQVEVGAPQLAASLAQIFSFGLFSVPDINGNPKTWIFIAGTPWTLQYEWLFYFSLPLVWAILRRGGERVLYGAAILIMLCLAAINTDSGFIRKHMGILSYFTMGTLALFASRIESVKAFSAKPAASWAIAALLGLLALFKDWLGVPQAMLMGLAFTLIVSGCDIFGLLRLPAMRLLGEISFSVYLLHGCVLYLVMFVAYNSAIEYGHAGYWLLSLAVVPLVILVSIVTFRTIELPGQAVGRQLVRKLLKT